MGSSDEELSNGNDATSSCEPCSCVLACTRAGCTCTRRRCCVQLAGRRARVCQGCAGPTNTSPRWHSLRSYTPGVASTMTGVAPAMRAISG